MSNKKIFTTIGIMTGTSMDGLDLSLIKTDGLKYFKILEEYSYDYSNTYKIKLKKFVDNFSKSKKRKNISIKKYEVFVTNELIKIIKNFIKKIKYNKQIDLIGFSGQTIFHDPKNNYSLQLGSGKILSNKIKIPVVTNFRDKDVAMGGQGAPIGCYYHKYLINKINQKAAIVNIGGVTNITILYKRKLIGFDLGPGNALIDDLTNYFYKKKFDNKGSFAEKGSMIENIFKQFKKNIFFRKKYPKSLDRNHFNTTLNKLKKNKANDSIHTASLMTVYSIIQGLKLINNKIDLIILTGGGRKNIFLVNKLKDKLYNNTKIKNIDDFGFNGDMIESQMFAYLAVRSLKKLNISHPSITGVKKPISGGKLYNYL